MTKLRQNAKAKHQHILLSVKKTSLKILLGNETFELGHTRGARHILSAAVFTNQKYVLLLVK
jgi:hypothetical protein